MVRTTHQRLTSKEHPWTEANDDSDSESDDDDDSDDDAPGMTPEDLGMTEGGGKGRAKASHHVTWLIASTSTEAQVS